MSKLALVFFALCVLYAVADAHPPSDPLIATKIKLQGQIRDINTQISINNRDIGFKISLIRNQQSVTLKYLITEMEHSGSECAIANLLDAQTIWALINSLDSCRLNQNYEIVRATAIPVLNHLVGDAGRAIGECKADADYPTCAVKAADFINESGDKIIVKALDDMQKFSADSTNCLDLAGFDLQNRIDAVGFNWNFNCKNGIEYV